MAALALSGVTWEELIRFFPATISDLRQPFYCISGDCPVDALDRLIFMKWRRRVSSSFSFSHFYMTNPLQIGRYTDIIGKWN